MTQTAMDPSATELTGAKRSARTRWGWALGALALLGGLLTDASRARADVIELVGGRAVHGKVLHGQTSDDGLAVELFDTGGVVVVKWDHIVPARAKQLRVETGIETPEEEQVLVAGHRVLLVTGKVVEGLALNPDQKDQPLQIKTRTSVQPIDRAQVARIDETQLDGLLVYNPDELYQLKRDENPPDNAAAHKAMALLCMRIGALTQAKTHLDAAMADAEFVKTPEGKSLPAMKRQLETLIMSAGAQELAVQIRQLMRGNRWNLALTQLDQLDSQYKDDNVRRLIRFDLIASQVIRGRKAYFGKEVQKKVYATMGRMIDQKARERKPLREDPDQPRGVATPGTLASARQWAARDLPTQLWEKVAAELELKPEEMDAFWKDRSGKGSQQASYGTGSFIVVKRATLPRSAGGPGTSRRPAGSARDSGGGPGGAVQRQSKEDKPKTEEEWWESVGPSDKARWLTAYFAENSGLFDVLRADEGEMCDNCGGKGVLTSTGTDGSTSQSICNKCNGSTKFRKVVFR